MSEASPNAIHWFEIPATDLDRAANFYEAVLATKLRRAEFGYAMAIFQYAQPGIGGAIIQSPKLKPSAEGTLVYLNCPALDEAVARIEPAGGKVLLPKTEIAGGFGFEAILQDTEGNRVALHTR